MYLLMINIINYQLLTRIINYNYCFTSDRLFHAIYPKIRLALVCYWPSTAYITLITLLIISLNVLLKIGFLSCY